MLTLGKRKVAFGIKNNLLVVKNGRLYSESYLNWKIEKKNNEYVLVKKNEQDIGRVIKSLALVKTESSDNIFSNRNGTKQLKELGLEFDNPKPTNLIKKVIGLLPDNGNATVLDFFAGSGTTGQAVLEVNREDGDNRQFILCVNQDADSDKICYERLHRVMVGKTTTGQSDFAWINKNQPFGNSLEVNNIGECDDNDPDVFTKIDQSCYFDQSATEPSAKNAGQINSAQAKRDWVCREFRITCKEKQINEEK